MELVISIWLVCGIIAVLTASSKGQKELKILFSCVVLGPIGLAMAMRKKKLKLYCPYCKETVDIEKGRCSLCGLMLDGMDTNKNTVVSRQCPRCGKSDVHDAYIEDGSWGKWCPNCKISIKKIRDLH